MDKVRRAEHRQLLEQKDESLTGTKYLWLQGACAQEDWALEFAQLCERNLKTSRAWYHKENFNEFWSKPDAAQGMKFFRQWFGHARRSKLEPIKKTALTLQRHLFGLLNHCSALQMTLQTRFCLRRSCAMNLFQDRGALGLPAIRGRLEVVVGEVDVDSRHHSLRRRRRIDQSLQLAMLHFIHLHRCGYTWHANQHGRALMNCHGN